MGQAKFGSRLLSERDAFRTADDFCEKGVGSNLTILPSRHAANDATALLAESPWTSFAVPPGHPILPQHCSRRLLVAFQLAQASDSLPSSPKEPRLRIPCRRHHRD